jgi:hypothetical protein
MAVDQHCRLVDVLSPTGQARTLSGRTPSRRDRSQPWKGADEEVYCGHHDVVYGSSRCERPAQRRCDDERHGNDVAPRGAAGDRRHQPVRVRDPERLRGVCSHLRFGGERADRRCGNDEVCATSRFGRGTELPGAPADRVWIQASQGDAVLVVRREDGPEHAAFFFLGSLGAANARRMAQGLGVVRVFIVWLPTKSSTPYSREPGPRVGSTTQRCGAVVSCTAEGCPHAELHDRPYRSLMPRSVQRRRAGCWASKLATNSARIVGDRASSASSPS